MQPLIGALDAWADPRPLAIARIVVGIAALLKAIDTTPLIGVFFTQDYVRLPHALSSPLPDSGLTAVALIFLWTVFALLFLIGYVTPLAGAGLCLSILAVITFDQQLYSNHLYLLASVVALLTIASSGARFSLDAWIHGGRPAVAAWPVWLLKLQLTSIYFFAAITKLNADFLAGDVFRAGFEPAVLNRIEQLVSLELLALAAVMTELFLAVAFWLPRIRWCALVIGVGFHAANVVFIDHGAALALSAFGIIMLSVMLIFFRDVIERVLDGTGESVRSAADLADRPLLAGTSGDH